MPQDKSRNIELKKLVFASVLKPVQDTRMWHKMGQSAVATGHYQVMVVGAGVAPTQPIDNANFYPIFGGKRLGIWRWWAGLKYAAWLSRHRPDIQVVCSPELLAVAAFYRWIAGGTKLVYDVRENYLANIWHTDGYHSLLKPLLDVYTRIMESLGTLVADQVWVAESCYITERPSLFGKALYLPNLYDNRLGIRARNGVKIGVRTGFKNGVKLGAITTINLLVSGTLGTHYGTLDAIEWAISLNDFQPISLTIAGYSADPNYAAKIIEKAKPYSWIKLIGITTLVPYAQIIELTKASDYSLLPYRPNPSTAARIPTKIYEGLALSTPMLISPNEIWQSVIERNTAGLVMDFKASPTAILVQNMINTSFFTQAISADQITWQAIEPEFINALAKLYL